MTQWPLLARMALADLWHDRKISLCIAASLVAVIAPLLLLFGLKYGVVSQLQQALLNDPRNLEIRMLSSGNFSEQWLAELRARPATGFAIGLTRTLNTEADLRRTSSHFSENTEVIPTASGDPLTGEAGAALTDGHIILSASAARKLDAELGQSIDMMVSRRLDGQPEQARRAFVVAAILPASTYNRAAAFVTPTILHDMEWFRDGYTAPRLGAATGTPQPDTARHYARARIYASELDQVEPLEKALNAMRIETISQLADIENVKAINRVLGLIFGVIAFTAALGCTASLAGAFLANVDRKRKDLAVLRLLGFSTPAVASYIVMQTLLLTCAAYAVALALYGLGSSVFNYTLTSAQATHSFACQITVTHAVIAFLLAMTVAAAVSAIGVLRAVQIEPAESLREI